MILYTGQQLAVVDSLDTNPGIDVWSWRFDRQRGVYHLDLLTPPHLVDKVSPSFLRQIKNLILT